MQSRRACAAAARARLPTFIDGVHPPADAELDARPASEECAGERRLESEAVDVVTTSQRW